MSDGVVILGLIGIGLIAFFAWVAYERGQTCDYLRAKIKKKDTEAVLFCNKVIDLMLHRAAKFYQDKPEAFEKTAEDLATTLMEYIKAIDLKEELVAEKMRPNPLEESKSNILTSVSIERAIRKSWKNELADTRNYLEGWVKDNIRPYTTKKEAEEYLKAKTIYFEDDAEEIISDIEYKKERAIKQEAEDKMSPEEKKAKKEEEIIRRAEIRKRREETEAMVKKIRKEIDSLKKEYGNDRSKYTDRQWALKEEFERQDKEKEELQKKRDYDPFE